MSTEVKPRKTAPSIAQTCELIKNLKELGVYKFKNADMEIEFSVMSLYPKEAVEMAPMPETTFDPAGVDDGSERRKLLNWST